MIIFRRKQKPVERPQASEIPETQRIMGIPNKYVLEAPDPQDALDLFKGQWMCDIPSEEGVQKLESGLINAFDDFRINWGEEQLGSFAGHRVLELGPMEAGHTYMLEKRGAVSVLAIEASTYSYLKCLTVKEVTGLTRSRFLLGDFVEYLRNNSQRFDLCLASGVLYHMRNPAELLYLIAQATDNVLIWTHYYERNIIESNPDLAHRFESGTEEEFRGFKHKLYRYQYTEERQLENFAGGNAPYSCWMSRDGILDCLRAFGFTDLRTGVEQPDHPNGPAFGVVGRRPSA